MITGADVRRYRKLLGLSQVEVARRIDISQSAFSSLESGRIAVSDDHLASLKKEFSAPSFNPAFTEFLRVLERAAHGRDSLPIVSAGQFLTLTVWRWQDGMDLGRIPQPEQAVGLVTVPATDQATIALEMNRSEAGWEKGDVLVFTECEVIDLRPGDLCVVQYRRGKRSRSDLAIIEGDGSIRLRTGREVTSLIPKDSILTIFRAAIIITRVVLNPR